MLVIQVVVGTIIIGLLGVRVRLAGTDITSTGVVVRMTRVVTHIRIVGELRQRRMTISVLTLRMTCRRQASTIPMPTAVRQITQVRIVIQ